MTDSLSLSGLDYDYLMKMEALYSPKNQNACLFFATLVQTSEGECCNISENTAVL